MLNVVVICLFLKGSHELTFHIVIMAIVYVAR